MALPKINNAESQTSGTTVTTGNSGGTDADAFDTVTIGANMTLTYDNATPAHGSNSFKIALTSTATNATYVGYTYGETVTELWGAYYWWCNVVPPVSSIRMASYRNSAAQVSGIKLQSGAAGLTFMNAGGTDIGTASGALNASTLYRTEFHIVFNTASGETARLNIYAGDSTTLLDTAFVSGVSMGAANNEFWVGLTTANFSSTSGDSLRIDDINLNKVGYPGPGPYTSAAPAEKQSSYYVRRRAITRR